MLNSGIGSTPKASDEQNFVSEIKNWWNECPLFTRVIIFVCTGVCLLGQLNEFPSYLVNNEKTLSGFQITRLIFSPFATRTIAELIFSFLAYLPIVAEQEKRWGTLKTSIDFILKNIEINIVFLIFRFILSTIHDPFGRIESYGLWGIFMFKIAEQYLDNPDGATNVLGSFRIPTKIYPIALFVLFSVISNSIRIDILAALAAGFVHIKFLDPYYLEFLNDRKIKLWEISAVVGFIRTLPNYVSLGSMPGNFVSSYDNGMVQEAGSPVDLSGQDYSMGKKHGLYTEGFDAFGTNQNAHNDLVDDIEKQ